jgi:hypothetical protein
VIFTPKVRQVTDLNLLIHLGLGSVIKLNDLPHKYHPWIMGKYSKGFL